MVPITATGKQGGFTYIGLLIWVALTGAALGGVAEVWHTTQRREKEAQLLFVGEQYRVALERFGGAGKFPKKLEELLGDEKTIPPKRYLRRIYPDPMTNSTNWGTVTTIDGQIIGVYSQSGEAPLKVAGFKTSNAGFAGARRYSEWVFMASNAPKTTLAPNTVKGGKTASAMSLR